MSRAGLIFCFLFLVFGCAVSAGVSGRILHSAGRIEARADTAKKGNLLTKLFDALKFRKNSITKEQQRVQAIIAKMISKDATLATVQDLEKLRQEMSENDKLLLDTLLALIKEIRIPETVTVTPDRTPGAEGKPGAPKPFQVTQELDPNDQYINDLVDKLVPALTETKNGVNAEEVKKRRDKLALLRRIYASRNSFIDTLNDSIGVHYRVKLGHRADVIGNFRYDETYAANAYNLSTLSTLAYSSYEIDGFTGMASNFNHWSDASIISGAQEARAKIWLTVTSKNSAEAARFLTSEAAQKAMISNTLDLLERRNADGLNVSLGNLSKKLRAPFAAFVRKLSHAYRAKIKQYEIGVTLPAFDDAQAYDILQMDSLVDRYIIDFSKKPTLYPGPVAPLNDESNYSIESSVSRYLNTGVAPYKFILCLPYYGARFSLDERTGTESFVAYVPYKEIRSDFPYAPFSYNDKAAYASIELRNDNGDLTGHIYYDNADALEKKYDFILQNGLGGVAIWHLGADDGYGELWDALAYKFVKIDTVARDTIRLRPVIEHREHGLFGYIKTNLVAYYYALQNPCDISYDSADPTMLTIFNILLGVIFLVCGGILIFQIKAKGEKWKWKKALIRVLIVCVNLFIITLFMWLYIDDRVSWFGAGENCIDMPFSVLLLIIVVGIVLGTLIMRFLIFPVLQHDEKP